MENNKFITRGISKEINEFVYGFPVYDYERKVWFIKIKSNPCLESSFIEIKQTPDRWTGLYHPETKEKIWENDIVENEDKIRGVVKYCSDDDYPAFDIDGEDFEDYSESNILSYLMADEIFKIVGNIHFNKELLTNKNNNG